MAIFLNSAYRPVTTRDADAQAAELTDRIAATLEHDARIADLLRASMVAVNQRPAPSEQEREAARMSRNDKKKRALHKKHTQNAKFLKDFKW